MRRREKFPRAEIEVGLFNARHPPGTRVRYTHPRDGRPHVGSTVSRAFVADGRGAVVLISGCLCLIELARVEPLAPAEEIVDGGWFPQQADGRRQTVDRDAQASPNPQRPTPNPK